MKCVSTKNVTQKFSSSSIGTLCVWVPTNKYLGIQKLEDVELLVEGKAIVVDHVLAMAILVASFVTWGCDGAPWFPTHFKFIKFPSTFDFVRNLMVCGWRCSKDFPSS